jgi:Ca2+-binding RTX toxin-like protein
MANPNDGAQHATVAASDPAAAAIASLAGGVKWAASGGAGVSLTFSFPWSQSAAASWSRDYGGNEPASGYALNAMQQTAVRIILQSWSNVAGIRFTEVTDAASDVGDLRFAWTASNAQSGAAWANYPNAYYASGGDVWLSQSRLSAAAADWQPGGYAWQSVVHEIGHALGLTHPFEGNPVMSATEATRQYTVMAYAEAPDSLWYTATPTAGGVSYAGKYVQPAAPMLYDIAAIQHLYGPNLSYRNGDDLYAFDPATPFYQTIWDAGGNDTISLAAFTAGSLIDLNEGAFSSLAIRSPGNFSGTYDGANNLAIAAGARIENAIGGAGNDLLFGNALDNALSGGSGDDTLMGGAGADTIDGGAGIDTAAYDASRAVMSVRRSAEGVVSVAPAGGASAGIDGIDTLSGVERIRFSDMSVNLLVGDNAHTIPAPILQTLQELYLAFFNRIPEADGLNYWIDQVKAGLGLNAVADGFYRAALSYPVLTGYTDAMSGADFVSLIYRNVLGRSGAAAPPAEDVHYWAGELAAGHATRGSLVRDMLFSAHTFKGDAAWGWVADLLDNKLAVSDYFAVRQGLSYNTPEESITLGMAIAAAVTPDDTATAIGFIGLPPAAAFG